MTSSVRASDDRPSGPTLSARRPVPRAGLPRERLLALVFGILTGIVIGLCLALAAPFVAPLTWALVLAVIAHPLHTRVIRRIRRESLAAAVTWTMVAVMLLAPVAFVSSQIARETMASVEAVKDKVEDGRWRRVIERNPRLAPVLGWVDREVNVQGQVKRVTEKLREAVTQFVSDSLHVVTGWLIMLFLLFYFLRDRQQVLGSLRAHLPLTDSETERVFRQVRDTIDAVAYGTLAVALLQGILGGLMFWWLELPAPLLWGAVMAFLAILPVLGAAIVWIPAALFLLLEGSWDKALLLTAWGGIVMALIDNVIYPILVKDRLRLHTVPVFISMLGGLVVFGAAGIVLGPVLLVLTFALIEIWRHRVHTGGGSSPMAD